MKHSVPLTQSPATPALTDDLRPLMDRLQADQTPYVLATVVRTISVTAAKAGAKCVIAPDGTIAGGWIGGGCARSAVLKASAEALKDGETRLISIQPEDLLAERGVEPGEQQDGVHFARNMCPSQGTMDIFIEPVLPRPSLVLFGASPVAVALARQAPTIGFSVSVCGPAEDRPLFDTNTAFIENGDLARLSNTETYILVSTQGRGDLAALDAVIGASARHVGFVGSRRKIAALKDRLREKGHQEQALDRIKGPAGLDLGAITPEEIALSILAELLMIRRQNQRQSKTQST